MIKMFIATISNQCSQKLSVVSHRHSRYQHDVFIASNQMRPERLVIVARWFKTEYGLLQPVLIPYGLDMSKEFSKSVYCVFKDQPPQKRLSRGGTYKCMMFVLGNINTHDHVLIRSPDPILHLTILLEPDKIFYVHDNPGQRKIQKILLIKVKGRFEPFPMSFVVYLGDRRRFFS